MDGELFLQTSNNEVIPLSREQAIMQTHIVEEDTDEMGSEKKKKDEQTHKIKVNFWNHIALVYDASEKNKINLYLNCFLSYTSEFTLPQDLFRDQVLAVGREKLSAEITEFKFWAQALSLAAIKDQHRMPLELVYEKKRDMKMRLKKVDKSLASGSEPKSFGLSGPGNKQFGAGLAGPPGEQKQTFGLAGPGKSTTPKAGDKSSSSFGLSSPDKSSKSNSDKPSFGLAGPDKTPTAKTGLSDPDKPTQSFGPAGLDKTPKTPSGKTGLSDPDKPASSFGLAGPDKTPTGKTGLSNPDKPTQSFGLAGPDKKPTSQPPKQEFGLAGPSGPSGERVKKEKSGEQGIEEHKTPKIEKQEKPEKTTTEEQPIQTKKEPAIKNFNAFEDFSGFPTQKPKKVNEEEEKSSLEPVTKENVSKSEPVGNKNFSNFASFDSWGGGSTKSTPKPQIVDPFSSFGSTTSSTKPTEGKQGFADFSSFNTFTSHSTSSKNDTEAEPKKKPEESKASSNRPLATSAKKEGLHLDPAKLEHKRSRSQNHSPRESVDQPDQKSTKNANRMSAMLDPSFHSDDAGEFEMRFNSYSGVTKHRAEGTPQDPQKLGFGSQNELESEEKKPLPSFSFAGNAINEIEIAISISESLEGDEGPQKLMTLFEEMYDSFTKVNFPETGIASLTKFALERAVKRQ